ncbi:MAG: transcription termination/antitermination factor NusG [Acholeplasmatales bacterium]|nr:transcription termination/antitermination factor NusG [Acholeplasmatales bacterium]
MRRWYIVTTYSGYENSVKTDLERRRESMNMQDLIYQVLVPEEIEEVVDKKGKKKQKVNKLFPGYVFVEMEVEGEMDEDAWFMVRNTPKVTGFLGSSGGGTKPVPVSTAEMDAILRQLGMISKPKFEIEVGDRVEIVAGSFGGRVCEVSSVNTEKEVVTVLVEMFGRIAPMEFPFSQVKKI